MVAVALPMARAIGVSGLAQASLWHREGVTIP